MWANVNIIYYCVHVCGCWKCSSGVSWLLSSPIGSELRAHTEAALWLKTPPAVYSSKISAFHLPQAKAITSNTLPSLQMIILTSCLFVNVTLMALVPFIRLPSSMYDSSGVHRLPTAPPCPPLDASGVSLKRPRCVYSCLAGGKCFFYISEGKCSVSRHAWRWHLNSGFMLSRKSRTLTCRYWFSFIQQMYAWGKQTKQGFRQDCLPWNVNILHSSSNRKKLLYIGINLFWFKDRKWRKSSGSKFLRASSLLLL